MIIIMSNNNKESIFSILDNKGMNNEKSIHFVLNIGVKMLNQVVILMDYLLELETNFAWPNILFLPNMLYNAN